MEIKVSVPELVNLINEIQAKPQNIFEMVRMNVQEEVGKGDSFCCKDIG